MPVQTSAWAAGASSPVAGSTAPMRAMMFRPGRRTKQKGQRPMQKLYMRALSKRRRRKGMQQSWSRMEMMPDMESA